MHHLIRASACCLTPKAQAGAPGLCRLSAGSILGGDDQIGAKDDIGVVAKIDLQPRGKPVGVALHLCDQVVIVDPARVHHLVRMRLQLERLAGLELVQEEVVDLVKRGISSVARLRVRHQAVVYRPLETQVPSTPKARV